MKKIFTLLAIIALVVVPVCSAAEIAESEQVKNGTFDTNYAPWDFMIEAGGDANASVVNGELKIHVASIGKEYWSVRITHEKIQYVKGQTYVVKFDARSTTPGTIALVAEANFEPWNNTYLRVLDVALTDKMATYTYEFTMKNPRDNRARLVFCFGKCDENSPKGEHDIYLDNISLTVKK